MNKQRKKEFDRAYLEVAKIFSTLSRAKRSRVGAVIVKDKNIISFGFNGTPSGRDNYCEYENENGEIKTKQEVLHGESNAILKAATSTYSTEGAILYQTLSPCFECCKLIIQAKIKEVVYLEEYRDTSGLDLLQSVGIKITHFKEEQVENKCEQCRYGGKMKYTEDSIYYFKEIYKKDKNSDEIIKINYLLGEHGCRMYQWFDKEKKCLTNSFSEYEE
jgi:dCMP deaminase